MDVPPASDLRAFFTAHPEYKVIHGHYSGFGMFYNAVARRCGVPVRAGHSHNTAYEHNLVGQLDRLMSSRFDHDLTHRFACSQRAGEMLYGKHPFTVLPNGIMTDVFALHDPAARAALGLPCFVADTVDPGAAFAGNIHYLPLQNEAAWADSIAVADLTRDPNAQAKAIAAGFDVHISAGILQKFYLEQTQKYTKEVQP